MTAITVAAVQTPLALAQGPPAVHIGNPHDFQPGPPIPSCNSAPTNPQAGGCKVVM